MDFISQIDGGQVVLAIYVDHGAEEQTRDGDGDVEHDGCLGESGG